MVCMLVAMGLSSKWVRLQFFPAALMYTLVVVLLFSFVYCCLLSFYLLLVHSVGIVTAVVAVVFCLLCC